MELDLDTNGTAKDYKMRLTAKQNSVLSTYKENKWNEKDLIFDQNTRIEAITFSKSDNLMYAACPADEYIGKCTLKENSVGLRFI